MLQVPLQPKVLVLAGNVVNAGDKKPVGGIKIEVTPEGKKPISAVTDDEGNYRVEGVPVGPTTVVVKDDSFVPESIKQDFRADAEHVNFVMNPKAEQGHGPTAGQVVAKPEQIAGIADTGRGGGVAGQGGPGSGGGAEYRRVRGRAASWSKAG